MTLIDRMIQKSQFLWKIDDKLKRWKLIHLCWLFEKLGLPVPRYFVGTPAYSSDLIPTMTSNTAPSGVASADSILDTGYEAYKCMDDANPDYYCWHSAHTLPHWVQYQFPSGKTIQRYTITSRNYISPYIRFPIAWTLRGSNNGSSWDILDTRSGQSFSQNQKKTYDFSNVNSYTYYRLYFTASDGGSQVAIGEWELMESEPAAPSGCTSSYVATNNAKCTWNDNSSNETNFRIEKDIDGAGFSFWKNVAANVVDSGTYTLGANHQIRFRVRAYNTVGYSAWSTSGYTYTTPTAPSGCAGHYVATDKSNCTWNDNSAYESGFDVDYRINGGSWVNYQTTGANVETSSTYTVGANKYIEWRVRSYRGSLYSTFSYSGIVYTTPTAPSGATTHYVATNKAHLHWTDNSAYESGFRLEYAVGVGGWTYWYNAGANVIVSSDGSFGANTRVKIRVRAYIGSLYSAWSEGSYVYTVPTAPSGVSIVWATLNETITVSWTDNSAYEQDFEIAKDKDGAWTYGTYDTASPYSDTAPTGLDHRYRHAVRARCPDGRLSAWAYSGYIYSTPNTPSGINLSWLSQDETVRISWTDNSAYEQDFDIEKKSDEGGYGHLVYDAASPYDDATPSGTDHRYAYQVRARCPDGRLSSWNTSGWIYSTPGAPTNCAISPGTINVTWTDNSAYEDGFKIERELDGGGWNLAHTTGADEESWADASQPTEANEKYQYRVRAYKGSLYSGYSTSNFVFAKTFIESLNLQDTYSRVWSIYRTFTENLNLSDIFLRTLSLHRTFTEILTLTDTVNVFRMFHKIFTETLTLSDTLKKKVSKVFTENITLSDVFSRRWTIYRTYTETINLADTIAKKIKKTFEETLYLTDIFSRIVTWYRTFTETLTLTDSIKRKINKVFIETLTLTDTVSKKIAKLFIETLHLTDTFSRIWTIYRIFTEKIALTDKVKAAKVNLVNLIKKLIHLEDIED